MTHGGVELDDADSEKIAAAAARAPSDDTESSYLACKESAYGELMMESVASVLSKALPRDAIANSTLLDMGSGRGMVVSVAAMQLGFARAWGVELSSSRHAMACASLRALSLNPRATAPAPGEGDGARRGRSSVALWEGDMLEWRYLKLLRQAHVVFTTATCYRPALLSAMLRRLLAAATEAGRTISLVMVSRSCARGARHLLEHERQRITLREKLVVAASWVDDARVYICDVLPAAGSTAGNGDEAEADAFAGAWPEAQCSADVRVT